MKVKVYVIDLPIPSFVKKWGPKVGIPTLAILAGGVALAGLPGGYQDGQPLTAEELTKNFQYLQNEITTLQGQVHPASAFRAELTNATSLPMGSTAAKVVFNNVLFDAASEYNSTTGTFSPAYAGTYLITCGLDFVGVNGVDYGVTVLKNGTVIAKHDEEQASAAGFVTDPALSFTYLLAAGDAVECDGYTTGASQALYLNFPSYFGVVKLY